MLFCKLTATMLAMGLLVAGSLQLKHIEMPSLHNLCGAWG